MPTTSRRLPARDSTCLLHEPNISECNAVMNDNRFCCVKKDAGEETDQRQTVFNLHIYSLHIKAGLKRNPLTSSFASTAMKSNSNSPYNLRPRKKTPVCSMLLFDGLPIFDKVPDISIICPDFECFDWTPTSMSGERAFAAGLL